MNTIVVTMKETTKDLNEGVHVHARNILLKSEDFLNGKGVVLLVQEHIQAESSID